MYNMQKEVRVVSGGGGDCFYGKRKREREEPPAATEDIDIAEALEECCNVSVPGEVILDILLGLPVKSLMRFKCVCKTFQTIPLSPTFIAMHLIRIKKHLSLSSLLHFNHLNLTSFSNNGDGAAAVNVTVSVAIKPYDIYTRTSRSVPDFFAGSANGLVCVGLRRLTSIFVLWNPATTEFRFLPDPESDRDEENFILFHACGFIFHPGAQDYKLVRIKFRENRSSGIYGPAIVDIFKLSTNSWRKLKQVDVPCTSIDRKMALEMMISVVANGSLHWMGRTEYRGTFESLSRKCVIAFDVGNEIFRQILLPSSDPQGSWECLSTFRENLAIFYFVCFGEFESTSFDIWVLNDNGAAKECWTKQFVIGPLSRVARPLGFWINGEIIFTPSHRSSSHWFLYDPHTKEIKKFPSYQIGTWNCQFFPYMESLVLV